MRYSSMGLTILLEVFLIPERTDTGIVLLVKVLCRCLKQVLIQSHDTIPLFVAPGSLDEDCFLCELLEGNLMVLHKRFYDFLREVSRLARYLDIHLHFKNHLQVN